MFQEVINGRKQRKERASGDGKQLVGAVGGQLANSNSDQSDTCTKNSRRVREIAKLETRGETGEEKIAPVCVFHLPPQIACGQ